MNEDRLDELEIKAAFQDKLLAELAAQVRQLAERVDKTDRELKQLKDSLASPELPVGAQNEKPPHY